MAFALVLACFALSGAAALLYQTAWLREFSIVFGTAELAVAAVLASYMAGLATGATIAGRLLGRVRRPVLVYALLEAGVALGALAVPLGLALARRLQMALLGGASELTSTGGIASSAFYLATAFVVIMGPTALMGATLPLLARYAVRRQEEIGGKVGTLYAVNTAGAVIGTLAAGFVLLPALGLRATVFVGVALNAVVFVLAALVARTVPALPVDAEGAARPARAVRTPGTVAVPAPERVRWMGLVLPIMLVSGAVSFTYEVLWTRLLGHVLGASVYAFATMLASVLVGITVGSAVAARLATTRATAARGLIAAELGTAVLSAAIYLALPRLPDAARTLGAGEHAVLGANALIAALVLFPATLCIGATFVFAVRILARDETDAGPAAARVYAWNTVGAIAGAILAAFVVVPGLGFAGTAQAAVATNVLLALAALLVLAAPSRRALATVGVLAAIVLLAFQPAMPERVLRTSPFAQVGATGRLLYAGVGRSATVLLLERDGSFDLRTNGLPEALIAPRGAPPEPGRMQQWLTALPVLARPAARTMLVIGFGGGVAIEAVPATVAAIDVVEIEPEVIVANRLIGPRRRVDPLADPRLRIVLNDARGALAVTDERWDLIVSQPSHPWTAGASHLYTREFLAQARRHLAPGGALLQWMDAGFVDVALLRTVAATVRAVFPHVRLYRPSPQALLFLASDAPLAPERDLAAAGGPPAAAAATYDWLGVGQVEDLVARLALDEAGVAALAADAPVNTDDDNRLAMRAPRVLRDALDGAALDRLLLAHDPVVDPASALYAPPLDGLDRVHLVHLLALNDMGLRAATLARRLPEPERLLAEGLRAAVEGDDAALPAAAARALALAPGLVAARFAVVEPALPALASGTATPAVVATAAALPPPAAAVVTAWGHLLRGEWAALAALDRALAAATPADLWYLHAVQARVAWRVHAVDERAAREALTIVDRALAIFPAPHVLLGRVKVGEAADRPDVVVETAAAMVERLGDAAGSEAARAYVGAVRGELVRSLQAVGDDGRVPSARRAEVAAAVEALGARPR